MLLGQTQLVHGGPQKHFYSAWKIFKGGVGREGGEDGDGAEGIEEGISRNSHMGRGQRGCEGSTSDHSKNGHQPTDQPEERQHKS